MCTGCASFTSRSGRVEKFVLEEDIAVQHKVSSADGDSIITYSLGSCIGVSLYDATKRVAGLLHFQLPTATMDAVRAKEAPLMFADSGLSKLIDMMVVAGADKKRLKCKIAGGAKMLESASTFDIGKRNHTSIRKALWQAGILLDSEDCGGSTPRTMTIQVSDGTVSLKRSGEQLTMK
jgi:chemotaxis protein CheD